MTLIDRDSISVTCRHNKPSREKGKSTENKDNVWGGILNFLANRLVAFGRVFFFINNYPENKIFPKIKQVDYIYIYQVKGFNLTKLFLN